MAQPFSRRSFIKAGLAGTAALAAAGAWYRASHGKATGQRFALDAEAAQALVAIAAALLKDAAGPSPAAIGAAVDRTVASIAGLPLTTQKEIQDLMGLLTFAPARRFLAGIPGPWSDAAPEQVTVFLQSWRTHRLVLMQSAYHALHDLVLGSWYADESAWEAIGYPGPLKALG